MDLEPPSRILTCIVRGAPVTVPIWEKGTGRSLLMLHGWGLDHSSLHELRDQLAPSYRVVTLDLPGFGRAALPSPKMGGAVHEPGHPNESWGVEEYAQMVAGLIRQLHPCEPVILLGHSFGGRIGMRLAADQPELVSELILIASAGLRKAPPLLRRMQLQLLRTLGKVAQVILPKSVAAPLRDRLVKRMASRDYLAAGPLRRTLVRVVNEDASVYAGSIQAPTLLVWGREDRDTPPWIGERLLKIIPNATLRILPDLDHHAILTFGRFQVAYQIRQHLRRQSSAASSCEGLSDPPLAQDLRPTVSP